MANQEPRVKTEDTGKIFEKALCNALNIPFVGKYKYEEPSTDFVSRLSSINELYPNLTHTAEKGARYDFTSSTDPAIHLSLKSTKKGGGKVAPQVVGQCQPEKFCKTMDIPYVSPQELKQYIQQNIAAILPVLVSHTFDSPILYYNQEKNTVRHIVLSTPIDWLSFRYKWTRDSTAWTNSTTLKIVSGEKGKGLALLEIQFHTTRTNMAIRWCFENFLKIFKENLTIVDL